MSNQFSDLSGVGLHDFGLAFNYAVWTPGTSVTLANVPWNQDYRDLVDMTPAALDSWIDNQVTSSAAWKIDKLTYAKPNEPIRLNYPIYYVQQFNYLRAKNLAQPTGTYQDTPTSYYYFITDVRYLAPNTTEVTLQLDVWSTYHSSVTFGQCYIERGHIGIANQNSFDSQGRSYLTIPEGLDIGSEYMIATQYTQDIGLAYVQSINGVQTNNMFHIVVVSTTDLESDPGTLTNPNLSTASGSGFQGLPNGANVYVFDSYVTFQAIMQQLAIYPWVAQGIITITAVPHLGESYFNSPSVGHALNVPGVTLGSGWAYRLMALGDYEGMLQQWVMRTNFRNDIYSHLNARYSGLKKFATYPYSAIEVTTYTGAPLILKPECIPSNDLKIHMRTQIVPPNPRAVIYPVAYNSTDDSGEDWGEFFDMATGIYDFPTFSVVNNGAMSYMAANAHRIAFGYTSADWSQQKALRSNTVAFGQANAGLNQLTADTNTNMAQIRATRDMQNDIARSHMGQQFINAGIGGVKSLVAGNPSEMLSGTVGMLQGAANAAITNQITTSANNMSASIAQTAGMGHYYNSMATGEYMRDTNKAYADYAAKGDYANEIAGINAKVQDIRLTQPTTAGQVGGDAHLLASYKWAIYCKIKVLQPAAVAVIGEYWLRYGYAVSRFTVPPPSLMCMTKFTYWKMKETYLFGNLPESHKQAIRGIFEKGVTVWADPSYIGTTDPADNQPLAGISL